MNKSKKRVPIKVAVRLRPLLQDYEECEAWKVDTRRSRVYTIKPQEKITEKFVFDHIYGPTARTSTLYSKTWSALVQKFLSGYNASIIMYGQTSSGKTHTLLGTPNDPGILPSTLRQIFEHTATNSNSIYTIWFSYLEIIDERVNDLLIPESTDLKVQETANGTTVVGARQQQVTTFDQIMLLLNYAEEQRDYRGGSADEHAARVHTICQIIVETKSPVAENRDFSYSVLNLVDMAGSEISTDSEVMQLQTCPDPSLGLFHEAMARLSAQKAPSTRSQSKLTKLLASALGGNALVTLICTLSPALQNYYYTLATLRFATAAKKVTTKPEVNTWTPDEETDSGMKLEVVRLREELAIARQELSNARNDLLEVSREREETMPDQSFNDYEHIKRENQSLKESVSSMNTTSALQDSYLVRVLQKSHIPSSSHHELDKLQRSYNFDVSKIQTNYQIALQQAAKRVIPDAVQSITDLLTSDSIGFNIRDNFTDIINELFSQEFLSNERIDTAVEEMRTHHESLIRQLDEEMSVAESKVEDFARTRLESQYQEAKSTLDGNYMKALHRLDELVQSFQD